MFVPLPCRLADYFLSQLTNKLTRSFLILPAAHSAVVLKAESVTDKTEWLNRLRKVISSKGGQVKGESGPPLRQSLSDGSLVNP